MGWVLCLVERGVDGASRGVEVLAIERPGDLSNLVDLGLTHAEGKRLLTRVQQAIVAAQSRAHATRRPPCRSCGTACRVKDYRPHRIATLFGEVTVRLPRCRCARCGEAQAGVGWPTYSRSTPEFDQVRAQLAALLPYRIAAGVLAHLLPVDAGMDAETLRAHTLKLGNELVDAAATEPAPSAAAITLTVDSTFIRCCEDDQRHLEVRLGNAEPSEGTRRVFAAVAKTDTAIETLIRCTLTEVGQGTDTELTAFTDGCPGLRALLVEAGVTAPPLLDWFHVAMRLQHAEKSAGSLPADTPEREQAKKRIITDVERLHWRIWHGKVADAQLTLEHIQHVMPAFHGERGPDFKRSASRRLWTALCKIDRYLASQSASLTNYAERHRADLRVGTALTEGAANFLVNRRTAKSQQMRWSRRGADRLLQVRCAVINGKLGSGPGHLFKVEFNPEVDLASHLAEAPASKLWALPSVGVTIPRRLFRHWVWGHHQPQTPAKVKA